MTTLRLLTFVIGLFCFSPLLFARPGSTNVPDQTVREEVMNSFLYLVQFREAYKDIRSDSDRAKVRVLFEHYFDQVFLPNVSIGIGLAEKHHDVDLLKQLFIAVIANTGSADETVPIALGELYHDSPHLFEEAFATFSHNNQKALYKDLVWGVKNYVGRQGDKEALLKRLQALRQKESL